MSALYPTPHIKATPDDFAPTVLMPGDPLRSEFIAKEFLEGARLVNNVRGVQGYTGFWQGTSVSVMASGVGMPSMGVYSHELFTVFGVKNIMRIGSAGALQKNVHLRDIVAGQAACTDSNYASTFRLPGTFAPIASYRMLSACVEESKKQECNFRVGNILSTDVFYADDEGVPESLTSTHCWSKMGVLAVEMESAALYYNAARYGGNALCICTISDHLITGEKLTPEERQAGFTQMITLALSTARALDGSQGV